MAGQRGGTRPGTSLAERLERRMRRWTWRSPIHRLRLRGRYPLQLLAVPDDPVPGNAAAGRALVAGEMRAHGEAMPLDALGRGGASPAFLEHVESFAWLRDLAAAVPREEGAPVAEGIARAWLATHARTVAEPAWRPDLWGRRILHWAAYAPYLLSGDEADRTALLNALARGARHLDHAADGAVAGLPRVTAWAGVVAAGLLIPGGDLRVTHGEAGIARALAQALHEDGGLATRVPAMQLALVELLVQLVAVYAVRGRQPAPALTAALETTVPALLAVTLGDGMLSSWQGSGPGNARRLAAAVMASGIDAPPPDRPRGWGYRRLAAATTMLVVDVAPPPAGALIHGGCASTLAFELSSGAQRIIVNCGGGRSMGGEIAAGLRTTAAHSTLTLADTNSTALHPDGSMGRGVVEVEVEPGGADGAGTLAAAHDGYVRRLGFRHARRLALSADGRTIEGADELTPAGRRRAPAATPFAARFHLAPGVDPVLTADGLGALLRLDDGSAWQFRAAGGTLGLEDSLWIGANGRPRPTRALIVAGEASPDGASIAWTFRRVR